MAENNQNRRYPPNLQGVLQLAVEAGSAAQGPAPVEPMSEEVSTIEYHYCLIFLNPNVQPKQAI